MGVRRSGNGVTNDSNIGSTNINTRALSMSEERKSIMEGGMNWKQMKDIVERQLNKLAMCKRGAIQTDINKQVKDLGKQPAFTMDERNEIKLALAKKVQKAMTPTLAQAKKYNTRELANILESRAQKVMEKAYDHPERPAWDEARKRIKKQAEEREATVDGDIQDILDQFTLGIKQVEDFPAIRDEFEATDY